MLRIMNLNKTQTFNHSSNGTENLMPGDFCASDGITQTSNVNTVAVQVVLSSCLFFVSALGNGLLCFLLARFKHLRTVANIPVADLAVVDLLNIIINGALFVCSVLLSFDTFRGRLIAWLVSTLHVFFAFLTLTTMFMMMMDRFLAIQFPFKYRAIKTKKKVLVIIFIKWLLSLVAVLAVFVPLYKVDLGECLVIDYRVAYGEELGFKIGRYFLGPPVLLGSICVYVISRRSLKSNNSNLPAGSSSQRSSDQRTKKALNTIVITLLIFCFSYIPSFFIGANTFRLLQSRRWRLFVLYFLLFIPSALNPFVYLGRVQCFQVIIRQYWQNCFCQNRVNIEAREASASENNLQEHAHSLKRTKHTSEKRGFVMNIVDVEEQPHLSTEQN